VEPQFAAFSRAASTRRGNRPLSATYATNPIHGGLQMPCLLADGWSEANTIRQAASAGVQLPGLSRLYAGEEERQGWLLGYSSLTAHEIETAMRRLARAIGS